MQRGNSHTQQDTKMSEGEKNLEPGKYRDEQLAAAEKLRGIYKRMITEREMAELLAKDVKPIVDIDIPGVTEAYSYLLKDKRMTDLGETNYADHPVSLGERRSEMANDGSLWKPRDALVDLLRKIDAGADVTDLIVCWRQRNKDGVWTGNFRSACADGIVAQGLLARTLYSMNT